ncbi:hypothetical protein GP486_003086 [Trichoglossum hirsutum]|uniref:Xylanolytic transcriptional activator regulatory domain-containing protein n=1 Tax=Trichoglossum hirsutum TaxID=265104 RepID=A0A9P8LDR6_9PEZI|nr:hypothetical protein GP486_003086 [Trichoglossum hirsutum]
MEIAMLQTSVNNKGQTSSGDSSAVEGWADYLTQAPVTAPRGLRHITRNRASYSCHACRRRKVKCDKVFRSSPQQQRSADGEYRTPDTDGKATSQPGVVKIDPPKSGDTSRNAQGVVGMNLRGSGYGQKRRRTTVEDLQDSTEITRGLSQQNNIPYSAPRRELFSAPPARNLEDTERRVLHHLTEIIKQYAGSVVGSDPATPQGPSQFNPWLQAKLWNPLSSSRDSTSTARNSTGSIPPTYHAAKTRYDESAGDHPYSEKETSTLPHLSHSNTKEMRFKLVNFADTGDSDDSENLQNRWKDTVPSHLATAPHDSIGDLALGHLSLQEGGQSRYIGNTFWAYIGDEVSTLSITVFDISPAKPVVEPQISELNQLLRDQIRQRAPYTGTSYPSVVHEPASQKLDPLPTKATDKTTLLRFEDPDGVPGVSSLRAMVAELPSKQQCDFLYRGFMAGIHPIIPLVHPPRFYQDYSEFWEWMERKEDESLWSTSILCKRPTVLPLLFAIIYGGSISCSAKELCEVFGSTTKARINEKLYSATTKSLSIVSFPRTSTIASLSAFLIVQTLMIREEQPMTRDGSLYGIEPVEAEVRRRVWWHILHMDVMTALASGLPPLLNVEGIYDTRPISELKDEYIGTPEGDEYELAVAEGRRSPDTPDDPIDGTKTSMTAVCYVMAAGRYFESTVVRKILSKILSAKASSKQVMEDMGVLLQELQSELDIRISRIPTRGLPEMGFTPEIDAELDLPIQQPATGKIDNGSTPAGDNEWQLRSDVRKLVAWAGNGTYQPMHATMILLVDLYERPDSADAPRSRSFIDEIFSLFGPDGGIVTDEDGVTIQRPLQEGGREAWTMLSLLRRKAWEKAGLDPDIMWTEARQREAGYLEPLTAAEKLMRDMREDTLVKESINRCLTDVVVNIPEFPAEVAPASTGDFLEECQVDLEGSVNELSEPSIAPTAGPIAERNDKSLSATTMKLENATAHSTNALSHPPTHPGKAGGDSGISHFAMAPDAPAGPQLLNQNNGQQPEYQQPNRNLDLPYFAPFPPTSSQPFAHHHEETRGLLPGSTPPTTIALFNGNPLATEPPPGGSADRSPSPAEASQPQQQPQEQEQKQEQHPYSFDDMDADFDWDEWDAVFRRYTSLEVDFMDVDIEEQS